MTHLRSALVFAACAFVSAYAQTSEAPSRPAPLPGILTSPDPTKPPPFVEVPGEPHPAGAAAVAISPELREKMELAQAEWRKQQGGAEFHPGLTYVHGRPILMLIVPANETAAVQSRRMKAIVGACEFLLDGDAFEEATICIVSPQAGAMQARNVEVGRGAFHAAAKSAGKSADLAAALAAAHADPAAAWQICTALGIQ